MPVGAISGLILVISLVDMVDIDHDIDHTTDIGLQPSGLETWRIAGYVLEEEWLVVV